MISVVCAHWRQIDGMYKTPKDKKTARKERPGGGLVNYEANYWRSSLVWPSPAHMHLHTDCHTKFRLQSLAKQEVEVKIERNEKKGAFSFPVSFSASFFP